MQGLTALAVHKFKRSYLGVVSICFIASVGLVSIFAYVLSPDRSQYANQMHLSIHSKPPGFHVQMLVQPNALKARQNKLDRLFFGSKFPDVELPISSYRIESDKLIYTPFEAKDLEGIENVVDYATTPKPYIVEKTFYLGTDNYGRDVLSRVLVGSRISFFIGFIAVFISLIIGIFLGSVSGYFGGKIDDFVMFLINVAWSIPTLLLVIAITLALGKGYWQVFIAVGLTMWVEVARVVRGEVMSVKEQQYITAARALGLTDFRIILRHILPNVMAPVIVISTANFAAAILIESGLSFLGIGSQPPMASWGAMIKNHYNAIVLGQPYLAIIPGLCIMALVMAFMLMGNSLREALDVKASN
ncbi:MAG: Oligopeptide transport system permease protein OppC [Formosa sp. Hel3_A1_48]|nr:MAG: Oligopeptide transport system permease protein OppC [Formosa sp. Hel3_A1_48]